MEEKRLDRILTSMEKYKIPQLIITSPSAIFYLTGKWIESGERMCAIFIDQSGEKKFVINALFPVNEDTGFDIITFNDSEDPIEKLTPFIDKKAILGIDKNWQSSFLIRLMDKLQGISVVNGSFIMDEVRIIKDDYEIQLLKEASKINDKVIDELIKNISEGSKEVDLARNLVDIYAKYGTEQFSFEPLIAFGKNGAEPHHSSNNSILKKGNSIIIDIGGKTNGYCSDMTRTVFCGEISERQKEIYNLVHQANLQGIKAVRPGTKFSDIDKAARDVIANAGYGEYFTHRTGHNVGIDVHEPTDVSGINNSEVEEGMVFSIEPGIYLPNEFGVRIEDLVLVTKDGCEILNSYDKNIKII